MNMFTHRISGASLETVKQQLLRGRPVVALVNSGGHWVIISGYRKPNFYYVVDYPNRGRWMRDHELGFDFTSCSARWTSLIPFGTGGYESRTLISLAPKVQARP
jgi:uncharacterized protein YvpB